MQKRIVILFGIAAVMISGALIVQKRLLVPEDVVVDGGRDPLKLVKSHEQQETIGKLPDGISDQLEDMSEEDCKQIYFTKWRAGNQPDEKTRVVGKWFSFELYSKVPAEVASLVVETHFGSPRRKEFILTTTFYEFVGVTMGQPGSLRPYEPSRIQATHLFIPMSDWRWDNTWTFKVVGGKKYKQGRQKISNSISLYSELAVLDKDKGLDLIKENLDMIVNPKDSELLPPTLAIFGAGHVNQIDFVMANGGDKLAKDRLGKGIMFYAARAPREGAVEAAKKYGGDPNERIPIGMRPIFNTIYSLHPQQLDNLVSLGADINSVGESDESLLCHAVYTNDLEILGAVLRLGPRKDYYNANGYSPMHLAGDDPNKLELFVQAGYSIELKTKKELFTPLLVAAYANSKGAVKWLTDQGADTSAKDNQGRDMYQIAAASESPNWEETFENTKPRGRQPRNAGSTPKVGE